MKLRAVIFDIYGTLLEVGPPPRDGSGRWESLWKDMLDGPARPTLFEFEAACEKIIAREHATARAAGVLYPEIFWPAVAKEALPELARLSEPECDEFLFQHAQLQRKVRLMPGAAETLAGLSKKAVLPGLSSNCQPYTLRELDAALSTVKLNRSIFAEDLCFFSFAFGFSKPDPQVFRLLRERLQTRAIRPEEAMVVGDRLDNDIEPAKAQGFQTWLLTTASPLGMPDSGAWPALQGHLSALAAS
jgi:FMN phosphatase YigB (HAD superfamily)